ncbi:hypothetical protein ABPG72_019099 [Tetrahymena utriculariae]
MGDLCSKNNMEISTIRTTNGQQQTQDHSQTILGSQCMMMRPTLPYQYSFLDQIQNHINQIYPIKKDLINSLPEGVEIIQQNKDCSGEFNVIKFMYLNNTCIIIYQQPLDYLKLSKELLKYKKSGQETSSFQSFPQEGENDFGYFVIQQKEQQINLYQQNHE